MTGSDSFLIGILLGVIIYPLWVAQSELTKIREILQEK